MKPDMGLANWLRFTQDGKEHFIRRTNATLEQKQGFLDVLARTLNGDVGEVRTSS